MILPDTSVWIDFLAERYTPQVRTLTEAIWQGDAVPGDLVVVEVLQGVRTPAQLRRIEAAFGQVGITALCGPAIAPKAAANYRALRQRGVTIRGTIDVIIATWCIENAVTLLHDDRDFDAMEQHLGLVVWRG